MHKAPNTKLSPLVFFAPSTAHASPSPRAFRGCCAPCHSSLPRRGSWETDSRCRPRHCPWSWGDQMSQQLVDFAAHLESLAWCRQAHFYCQTETSYLEQEVPGNLYLQGPRALHCPSLLTFDLARLVQFLAHMSPGLSMCGFGQLPNVQWNCANSLFWYLFNMQKKWRTKIIYKTKRKDRTVSKLEHARKHTFSR
jgi:hypothetical protein